jgi:predicted peptidase
MLQFSAESKLLDDDGTSAGVPKKTEDLLTYFSLMLVGGTLVFGFMISKDTFWSLHWDKHNLAKAQELANKSDRETFTGSNGDTISYLLMKPLDYDPNQKYPLVVCLPYGGYQAPAAQLLSSDVNRKKYPAFLFIPYSQPGSSWGGVPGRTAKDQLVYEALGSLKEPGIDPNRVYVSGVSLGGYGSWQFISVHPEMFAAAVPVCGAGDPKLAAKVADIPVWAFHGAKDRNVPVSGSRDMIAAIKDAGGDPRYTEFPDEAHNIWHQVTLTPGLLDWLFAQHKE